SPALALAPVALWRAVVHRLFGVFVLLDVRRRGPAAKRAKRPASRTFPHLPKIRCLRYSRKSLSHPLLPVENNLRGAHTARNECSTPDAAEAGTRSNTLERYRSD